MSTVLCRGATILQPVRRAEEIPVAAQRRILRAFSFSEADFLDALARLN